MKSLLLTIFLILSLNLSPVSLAEQQPVAVLNGKPIMSKQVEARAATKLYRLRWEIYDTLKTEAQSLVDERLLEEEAQRRELTIDEMLRQEVDEKSTPATDAEIDAYIKEHDMKDVTEEIRGRIYTYLTDREKIQRKLDFLEKLRKKAEYEFLLEPPERPRMHVSVEGAPAIGPPDAPITLIHFASFSCEHCAESVQKIRKLTEDFPGSIRWVHRDFLNMFDELGLVSAEAGKAAAAEGKFWQFHDAIYSFDGEYTKDDLLTCLSNIGVDVDKFEEARKNASFVMDIKHDIQDGAAAGVTGVPAIFINGRYIGGGFPYERIKAMVEEELLLERPDAQKTAAPADTRESADG